MKKSRARQKPKEANRETSLPSLAPVNTEAASSTPRGKGERVWAREIRHLFCWLVPGIGIKGSKEQRHFSESHCHSLPVLKIASEDNNKNTPYTFYLLFLPGPPNAHVHHKHRYAATKPTAFPHPDYALLLPPSHFIHVPATPFQQLLPWPGFVQICVWRLVLSVTSLNVYESWGHHVAFCTDRVALWFKSSWRHSDGQKGHMYVCIQCDCWRKRG